MSRQAQWKGWKVMATYLTPDKTTTLGGVTVKEYLLTKHNPNKIDMPTASMEGRVIGVTIHNTDWISVASGTTPAEQYTRATVNGNMNDVRVHYYVDHKCAWQNLPLSLSGWHAADGSGNGNRKTIAIECIMSSDYSDTDKKSEDNAAKLAAALLKKYGLGIDQLYTHTHWLNVRDGKTGTNDYLNTAKNSYKMCPLYILPHWEAFKRKVQGYLGTTTTTTTEKSTLYRVRKSWDDAASQIGAYSSLANAKKACKAGYSVYDESGNVVYTKAAPASYTVKVTATALNIRRGSGTQYAVVGCIRDQGTYTITETSGSWGKLKSGAGWICLDYTKKV